MHLERLISILEIVGQKNVATVAEVCSHTELPKPTVYRLVQDLVSVGLLSSVERGHFALGSRLNRITRNEDSDPALLEIISPTLARAAQAHGAAFFVSRLRGRSVEIIHVETPDNGVSYLHPGVGKRPLHACSCSKVIAAFSPELLTKNDLTGHLKKYTENTITSLEALEQELGAIRSRGYAECIEELERGICSVATTLMKSGHGNTLSIGVTASTRVLTAKKREDMGQELQDMAREISDTLGWYETSANLRVG